MIAARQPVRVATAFTAPINATAPADRAANSRRLWPARPFPRNARMTGIKTHGASIIGRVSDEIAPRVVSTRGDSVKASAPSTRELVLPMPRISARRSIPQKPTVSSRAHHSRWVTQPGIPSRSPARKNAPWGKR